MTLVCNKFLTRKQQLFTYWIHSLITIGYDVWCRLVHCWVIFEYLDFRSAHLQRNLKYPLHVKPHPSYMQCISNRHNHTKKSYLFLTFNIWHKIYLSSVFDKIDTCCIKWSINKDNWYLKSDRARLNCNSVHLTLDRYLSDNKQIEK